MSHVSMGKACIRPEEFCIDGLDYEATLLALEDLAPGVFEVVLGQKEFKWVGRWYNDYHGTDAAYRQGIKPEDYGKCEHVIRFKSTPEEEAKFSANPTLRPNEVGLVARPDNGMLAPILDFFGLRGPELKEKLGGATAPLLTQKIAQYKVVLQAARQKGHTVKRIEKLGDGKLRVVLGVRQPEKL